MFPLILLLEFKKDVVRKTPTTPKGNFNSKNLTRKKSYPIVYHKNGDDQGIKI
jgi:hypothetical protein